MNKEHIQSAADKIVGSTKEAVGKATGDKRLEVEGALDKVKGEARKVAGDVKDAVKRD